VANELSAIIYKEWREIVRENGSSKGSLLRLAMLAGLGLVVGWQSGAIVANGALLPAFGAFLGLAITIPSVADSFAGERERHTLDSLFSTPLSDAALVLGKLTACVLVAVIAVPVFVVLAIGAAVGKSGFAVLQQPQLFSVILATMLLGVLAALLIGALGLQVSLRAGTVRNALQGITLVLLALVGIPRLVTGLGHWSLRAAITGVGNRFGIEAVIALVLGIVIAVIVAGVAIDIRMCQRVRRQGTT
jgi:ABC-2 type transport system permease protein